MTLYLEYSLHVMNLVRGLIAITFTVFRIPSSIGNVCSCGLSLFISYQTMLNGLTAFKTSSIINLVCNLHLN